MMMTRMRRITATLEKRYGDGSSPALLSPYIPTTNARLAAYTGRYWNEGSHGMTVQIMEGKLFVDATERSFPFTHVRPRSATSRDTPRSRATAGTGSTIHCGRWSSCRTAGT